MIPQQTHEEDDYEKAAPTYLDAMLSNSIHGIFSNVDLPVYAFHVVDGDTVDVDVGLPRPLTRITIRVRVPDIDTPEKKIKGLNKQTEGEDTPDMQLKKAERTLAYYATLETERFLTSGTPDIRFVTRNRPFEKYGRLMGDLILPAEDAITRESCLSKHLIKMGLAVPYQGDRKKVVRWDKMLQKYEQTYG